MCCPDETWCASRHTCCGPPVLHRNDSRVVAHQRRLRDQGLVTTVQTSTHGFAGALGCEYRDDFTCSDISYVDDCVCPVVERATEFLPKMYAVAAVLHDVLHAYGFQVNYAQRKTEVLLQWAGDGSAKLRKERARVGDRTVPFLTRSGQALDLGETAVYRHLGTKMASKRAPHADTQGRTQGIRMDIRTDRRIFRNRQSSVHARLIIEQMLVLSRGMYKVAAWAGTRTVLERRNRSAILAVYRDISDQYWTPDSGHSLNDEQIIKTYCLIPPLVLMRLARMNLCVRICCRRPSALVRALGAADIKDSGWLSLIREDFEWMGKVMENTPAGIRTYEQWAELAMYDPSGCRRLLTKSATGGVS